MPPSLTCHRYGPVLGLGFALVVLLNSAQAGGDERQVAAEDLSVYDALIRPQDREHWSFRPVRRPQVPPVRGTEWVNNPIDSFVLAGLEARGWQPAPQAAPRALLRRIYLDLIGIPPSPEEQTRYLTASSPAALDEVVDSLLSHPGYGARWGRHWLDVVRYAETNGYERDAAKPSVWRFRDYVIQSLNSDKPFDLFVLEQIAGDELPHSSAATLIATGIHRLGHWDDEPADPKEDRFDQLDDIVNTTAQVFLGLSLGCARCHNHKFEPLTMLDYYRMVAVFDPLVRPQNGRSELDLPVGSRGELVAQEARDRRVAELDRVITQRREEWRREYLDAGQGRFPADALVALWLDPARRSPEQVQLALKFSKQLDDEAARLMPETSRRAIADLEEAKRQIIQASLELPRGYFMREPSPRAPETHLLLRGKAGRPGPAVSPGFPAVLVGTQPTFLPPNQRTTQRRLTLAQWIASAQNPLTARVIVNRVWQGHFGEGLVRTPNEFGLSGDRPTHPELLDWLADWFMNEAQWSLKNLHRLIVNSNTYRMSKRLVPEYGEIDPENRLLWRQNYHRLEVEAIRDSMLAVSGLLNHEMDGPSMYPQIPKEALDGHSDPDKIWRPFDEASASRRTVYAFIKRSMVVPMLEVLDLCDTTRSSAKRQVTTVAPQALALFNGQFVNAQAKHFAARLIAEVGLDPVRQIEQAYILALGRPPSSSEQAAMTRFLADETGRLIHEEGDPDQPSFSHRAQRQALVQACRTILNLNEFVYTD